MWMCIINYTSIYSYAHLKFLRTFFLYKNRTHLERQWWLFLEFFFVIFLMKLRESKFMAISLREKTTSLLVKILISKIWPKNLKKPAWKIDTQMSHFQMFANDYEYLWTSMWLGLLVCIYKCNTVDANAKKDFTCKLIQVWHEWLDAFANT